MREQRRRLGDAGIDDTIAAGIQVTREDLGEDGGSVGGEFGGLENEWSIFVIKRLWFAFFFFFSLIFNSVVVIFLWAYLNDSDVTRGQRASEGQKNKLNGVIPRS